MFANPSKATKKSSIQMQQMEAQMQHNHILHQKAVNDRERHSASLALQMGKKAKINAQLQVQVMGLADLMDDQIPVMDSVLCKKDPDRYDAWSKSGLQNIKQPDDFSQCAICTGELRALQPRRSFKIL